MSAWAPSKRERFVREGIGTFRHVTKDASVKGYSAVVEISGHVLERPAELSAHTLYHSCRVCEDNNPSINNLRIVVVDDIIEGTIVELVSNEIEGVFAIAIQRERSVLGDVVVRDLLESREVALIGN